MPAPRLAPSAPRRLSSRLLALVLALALTGIVGEIAVRAVNVVDRLNGFPRTLYAASDVPDLPYRLRPGIDVQARGVRVVTNARGLRGPAVAPVPASGTHRVIVLGDSVAFGYRLEWPDTFGERLAEQLARRSGGSFEVLDAGIEGYSTRNELALLQTSLLALRPETIVLLFNLNDYDDAPTMNALGVLTARRDEPSLRHALLARSELAFVLGWLADQVRERWARGAAATSAPGERFRPLDRYVSALRKQYYRAPDDDRWPRMVDALHAIAEACRANGIRLIVAIVPDGDQVGVTAPDLTPQARLRDVCRALALDCIDLHPAFVAHDGRELFLDIMHPNADGQRVMAQAVATRLLGRAE